jgi:hypothetical protein
MDLSLMIIDDGSPLQLILGFPPAADWEKEIDPFKLFVAGPFESSTNH